MNRAVDRGILELAANGRLSAASCLTKGRSFALHAPDLAALPIQKGLHLNLSEATNVSSYWQSLPQLIRNCYFRLIDVLALQTEIEEQLRAFELAFGQLPDYVDGHQHVHQLPVVRDCLIDVLNKRYGSRRPWLRSTCRPASHAPAENGVKARVIEALGARGLRRLAARHGYPSNQHLLGIYDFSGGEERYVELLAGWIEYAMPLDVIMCHPANGFDATDCLSAQRQAEYAVLAGADFLSLLAKSKAYVASGCFK